LTPAEPSAPAAIPVKLQPVAVAAADVPQPVLSLQSTAESQLKSSSEGANQRRISEDVPYFHGPIDDAMAGELLSGKGPGAFLCRNSQSKPSSCVIFSHINGSNQLVNFRLWKLGSGKYCVNSNPTPKDTIFDSVVAFVAAHSHIFSQSVNVSVSALYGDTH